MLELPAPVDGKIARLKTAQSAPEAAVVRIPMTPAGSPDVGTSDIGGAGFDGP